MKVDLTAALAVDHFDWQTQIPFTMESISFVQGTFPVTDKEPVELFVHHESEGQLLVRATVGLTVTIPCDRCLSPVSYHFSVLAERELNLSNEEQPSYIEGTMLDADGLLFHELLLQWPARVLCKDDCKGLCPVCGADLNDGECGCDRKVLDPRMAAIQDIFNQFQSEKK